MSETTEIVQVAPRDFMPVISVEAMLERRRLLLEFCRQVMVEGIDYGVIPGTGSKPTLLKPGAEKLCAFFGLDSVPTLDRVHEDWDKGVFAYTVKIELYSGTRRLGAGLGSCNSLEKKYRYRQQGRKCPICHKETIIKGKEEYGGGWLCYAKKGGCGEKFRDNDSRIVEQEVGQIANNEPYELVNTILKMGHKRALVAAVLVVTGASEVYTQDVEDMPSAYSGVDDFLEPEKKPEKTEKSVAKPAENKAEKPAAPMTLDASTTQEYQSPSDDLSQWEDEDYFFNSIDTASIGRGIPKANIVMMCEAVAKKKKKSSIALLEPKDRKAFYDAVLSGKMDSFKTLKKGVTEKQ